MDLGEYAIKNRFDVNIKKEYILYLLLFFYFYFIIKRQLDQITMT